MDLRELFANITCMKHIQVVYDNTLDNFVDIQKLHIGSAIEITGTLKESLGKGQDYEVVMKSYSLEGDCPEDYTIQPKRHTIEFLR